MDEMIEYLGTMTLAMIAVPMALGLAWISLRCVFDMMPAASRARAAAGVPLRRRGMLSVLIGGRSVLRGAQLAARRS
jgi:hypothetical protein